MPCPRSAIPQVRSWPSRAAPDGPGGGPGGPRINSMSIIATEPPRAGELPRLLPDPPARDLASHLDRWGSLPNRSAHLIDEVERAGLRGRGGAGFPTARQDGRRAPRAGARVVVANGTEGEPASAKDKTLLVRRAPPGLDGAVLAAAGRWGPGGRSSASIGAATRPIARRRARPRRTPAAPARSRSR